MAERGRADRVPRARRSVVATPRCHHGAVGDAELAGLGLRPHQVIDFSVNTNPLGPSRRVLAAIAAVDPARYPDPDCAALREAIAAEHRCLPEQVVVGNGSAEIIWLVALAFLRPGDRVLIVGPTFGEYERAARLVGARVLEWRARAEEEFRIDVAALTALLRSLQPRLCFLCHPNNPTGAALDLTDLAAVLAAAPRTLVVLDEAYLPLSEGPPDPDDLPGGPPANLLRLRSLTKSYALAGLRLGYALGSPRVVAALEAARPPWSVNAVAQAAGLAALADGAHVARARAAIAAGRPILLQAFERSGARVVPSGANFFLAEVGNGATLRAALLRRGICLRDAASFGLPAFVRVAVRAPADCERLAAALAGDAAAGSSAGGLLDHANPGRPQVPEG